MRRDCSNGKVYCIGNNVDDDLYIGSTTQALSKRMVKHRSKGESKEAKKYILYQKIEEYRRGKLLYRIGKRLSL